MKFFVGCLLILYVCCTEYGVIIDAGSSGSRAFVYSWPDRTYKSLPPSISIPVTQEKWATKATPAITTFVNNMDQLSSYISSLVQFAMGVLKTYNADYSSIPIYLFATAGVRSLPHRQRDMLMIRVRELLADKSLNPFKFENRNCRILSGEEEGVYGWISVNQILGTLTSVLNDDKEIKTFGSLDLGGGSLEITYYNNNLDNESSILENSYAIPFLNINNNLYTHSYLHYGLNDFYTLLLEYIIRSTNRNNKQVVKDEDIITNPCLPTNYTHKYSSITGNKEFIVKGESNSEKCNSYITLLLGLNDTCYTTAYGEDDENYHSCAIHGVYQSDINNIMFYGYGGLSHVPHILNSSKDILTLDEIYNYMNKLCSEDWNSIKAKYPDEDEFSSKYCYDLEYIYNVLAKALHVPVNEPRIYFTNKHDEMQFSWSLGGIMLYSNLLPWKYKESNLYKYLFISSVVIIGILIVIISILLCLIPNPCRKEKKFHKLTEQLMV